ncbi:unnamed protein product, partial [Laminaria digitata]
KVAEKRLHSGRSIGTTTSSDKFVWSRAVSKFLSVGAHPETLGARRQQEKVLRQQSKPWNPRHRQALWDQVAKMYPDAVKRETAVSALTSVDWGAVAEESYWSGTTQPSKKRRRYGQPRTAEECMLRWMHHDMPGMANDAVWSKEEDMVIIQEADRLDGREWVKVAEAVNEAVSGDRGRRTPVACLKRFQATLNTKLVNWYTWSKEEDMALLDAVK